MTSNERQSRSGYSVNGPLIRRYRQERGWTQEELAFHAKVSVRLVAKAESSESLSRTSVDSIALALATDELPLCADDLKHNPKDVVLEFLANLKNYQSEVIQKSRHLLSDDVVYVMPGDPTQLPFAGTHRGIEAADKAIRLFFEFVEITDKSQWTTEIMSCNGDEVIASQLVPAQLKGLSEKGVAPFPATLVVYRVVVKRGKIAFFDDRYPAEFAAESAKWQASVRDGN